MAEFWNCSILYKWKQQIKRSATKTALQNMTKTSARVAITKLAIIILLSAALVAVIGSGRGKVAHEVRPDLSDEIDKLSTGSDLVAGASSVKQVMVPIMESAAEDQVQVYFPFLKFMMIIDFMDFM